MFQLYISKNLKCKNIQRADRTACTICYTPTSAATGPTLGLGNGTPAAPLAHVGKNKIFSSCYIQSFSNAKKCCFLQNSLYNSSKDISKIDEEIIQNNLLIYDFVIITFSDTMCGYPYGVKVAALDFFSFGDYIGKKLRYLNKCH